MGTMPAEVIDVDVPERCELLPFHSRQCGTTSILVASLRGVCESVALSVAVFVLSEWALGRSAEAFFAASAMALVVGTAGMACNCRIRCALCRTPVKTLMMCIVPQWCETCGSLLKHIPRNDYRTNNKVDVERLLCSSDGVLLGLGAIIKEGMATGECRIEVGRTMEGADCVIVKDHADLFENAVPMPPCYRERIIIACNNVVFGTMQLVPVKSGQCDFTCGQNKCRGLVEISDTRGKIDGRLKMSIVVLPSGTLDEK